MRTLKSILLLPFLFLCFSLWAQNISIQVSADRVGVGEPFLVTYTIEGNVEDFTLPEFKDFKVSQSGKSTNMSIINGKISKSVGYNLTVIPLNVGTYEIGPAKAIINGKKVSSPPFTIEVVANSQDSRSQQNQQPNRQKRIDAPSDNWRDNILLLAEVDKNQIYVGEQITVTYKLLRRLDFQSMEVEKMPVFKGFLSEEMEIPPQQSEGVMEHNGNKYYFQAFRKVALFGAQPGKQAIDPLVARGVILIPERDPFFGTTIFSSAEPKMVVIHSNTLNINVLPLPTENQPANFSGAVGQFQAHRSVQNLFPKQGEATTVQVEVNGWGNLKAIQAIPFKSNASYELYEAEVKDEPRKNGEIYGGTRTFQYSLVPERSGEILIPKEEFVYFDPQKKSYITQELPAIQLKVAERSMESDDPVDGQFFVAQLKEKMNTPTKGFAQWPIALALVSGFPFLAFMLGAAWYKRKDAQLQKFPVVSSQLPDYNSNDKSQFSVLAQEFRKRMNLLLQSQAITDDDLLQKIEDSSVRQKASFVLLSCDRAAYSPLIPASIQDLKKMAEEVLSHLEKSKTV